jgi:hypothetical protein
MSDIVPPIPIPEPEGDAVSPYEQLQSRRRARRGLVAALLLATVGFAMLIAGPALAGAALFLPGLAGAVIAERRLARLPGPRVAYYHRLPYGHYDHSHGFMDLGGGDCGGGGDGGGG